MILLVALVAVVALIALVAGALGGGGQEGEEVEVARAQVRSITQTVTASGQVRPEVEVKISSDVSGEVVYLGVEEGDRVTRGQLLIRVRPEFYAEQRAQAEAGVLQAQADIERAAAERSRAAAELERQRQLFERGVIAEMEVQAARTALEVAQAAERAAQFRARAAQSTLRQSGQQLAQTAIYAPISGIVTQLDVELGERVVGTAQMAGTELMRIAELDRMTVEIDVNENDVVHIELGDSARVEVDAYPDRPLAGRVVEIASSARVHGLGTTEQATNFPVKVLIVDPAFVTDSLASDTASAVAANAPETGRGSGDGEPLRLRPGMSGTVDVFTRTVRDAVVVPLQAVTVRDFNEIRREEARRAARQREDGENPAPAETIPDEEDLRRVVFVLQDGKAVMREVTTGIADDTHIEIRSGLRGDETVLTGPFRLLRADLDDGDAVRVREGRGGEDE
ncbi:MAG TPA: efflux RND transporter periplasmic adaptor subunit [Rubricoccaceae bacterium]|nr:efflux RND transporter periplasmic adaptor subunit [Rubricoccaceae bacterium]